MVSRRLRLTPGDLGDHTVLIGVDLDTCRDKATGIVEAWALEIINRLGSYTEISPSDVGAKIFALMCDAAIEEVREATGIKHGRSFARRGVAEHPLVIEIRIHNRYFAVTGKRVADAPSKLAFLEPQKLLWLLTEYGPAFVGQNTDDARRRGNGHDSSRSGAAFRLAAELHRAGKNVFEEFCEPAQPPRPQPGTAKRASPLVCASSSEPGITPNRKPTAICRT